ncbi:methylmalonyl-coa epimerase-like protein [Leishmania mexicana MHOM/GT/2001/U1103]|uniref:Methylmalonyl-CoA epimerase, mitochondrial n=1 Tax=Leishmania mexicana (strain MHOM/GT/2001/U1103) TaxID=929439 RepID=E9AXY5_LEIMU|nr:methylmalonyl-coa epimerase-like protein [Leishmania mexicana MHOM/GT/2001/U1103]CBZ27826.1 methylmalonyl-coa epimerase-like protein [Leishmania mexicana MHOM/GT/2001/U1103]
MFRRCRPLFAIPANLGRFNHVAIAVPANRSIVEAGEMYARLFDAKVSEPVKQEAHGVITVFVDLGNTKIELLHPFGDKSPIAAFLERNKDGGMHHICLEVPDIAAAMQACKEANIRCLGTAPKIGAHGNPVIFLHPKDCGGVLTELEEVKS